MLKVHRTVQGIEKMVSSKKSEFLYFQGSYDEENRTWDISMETLDHSVLLGKISARHSLRGTDYNGGPVIFDNSTVSSMDSFGNSIVSNVKFHVPIWDSGLSYQRFSGGSLIDVELESDSGKVICSVFVGSSFKSIVRFPDSQFIAFTANPTFAIVDDNKVTDAVFGVQKYIVNNDGTVCEREPFVKLKNIGQSGRFWISDVAIPKQDRIVAIGGWGNVESATHAPFSKAELSVFDASTGYLIRSVHLPILQGDIAPEVVIFNDGNSMVIKISGTVYFFEDVKWIYQ